MRPAGYTLLRRGSVRVLLRHDVVTRLGPWLVAPSLRAPAGAEPIAGGRGGAFRVGHSDGLRVVVRPGRRGGWVGRVIGKTYLGWPPRPWRELAVSIEARARDVPTPPILAVRVSGWGLYRSAVVTEEVPETVSVGEALRTPGDAERRRGIARAAGQVVGRLHRAGLEHADLNLGNILVSMRPDDAAGLVIDLDKACLRAAPLPGRARRRSFGRLSRSWRRLTGEAAVPADLRQAFRAGYESVDGMPCEC